MTVKAMEERLNHIVEALGDIYLGMSDRYPRFFDQLDGEFSGICSKDGAGGSLSSVSENINRFLEEKEAFSRDNSTQERELIDTIGSELKKLARIEEGIGGMEECSEDLELISLNAMVSALKAGNNGGAFPYITRELQRVSRQSRENSDAIRSCGQTLDSEYKTLIEKVRTGQKETGKDMEGIYDSLETVISRLTFYDKVFGEQCGMLNDGIERMRSPLHMILEEVQKHDIVRQSVNHIIISLSEIHDVSGEASTEEKLNSLKFACQVYELSRFIIDDIRESVRRSYDRFSSEKRDVEGIIDSLGREMEQKMKDIGKDDIGARIASIRRSLSLYFQSQSDTLSNREMSAEHFDDLIDDLVEGIDQFNKVLSAIRNIHVASRIEVVKLKRLENMENIIDNIDITVGSMEKQLAGIGESVDEFRKASGEIISDFLGYFDRVKRQMQESMEELDPILETIESFRLSLNDQFERFVHVNRDFREFTGIVDEHLANMDELIKEIDRIRDGFEQERVSHEEKLNSLLEKSGYDSWSLKGDSITKLIDKFTIFIHKKVMTEGQEEDQANLDAEQAQASEITLF